MTQTADLKRGDRVAPASAPASAQRGTIIAVEGPTIKVRIDGVLGIFDFTATELVRLALCSVCNAPFRMLSGGVLGCAAHGIRSEARSLVLDPKFLQDVARDYLAIREQLNTELATVTDPADRELLNARISQATENAEHYFIEASRRANPHGDFCSVCRRYHGRERTHAAE